MTGLKLVLATNDDLSVREFSVHEALSKPWHVSLVVESSDVELDLGDIVGQEAAFGISGNVGHPRTWGGVVSAAAQLTAEPTGLSTYMLSLVPDVWLMTQRRRHRVFQHLTAIDIACAVLDAWSITPRLDELKRAYTPLEYRVQHGETDFEFLCRILEEAGVGFHFEEKVKEVGAGTELVDMVVARFSAEAVARREMRRVTSQIVLVDEPQKADTRGPIAYVDNPSQAGGHPFVEKAHVSYRVRPGRLYTRDYDFRRRDFWLEGAHADPGSGEELLEQHEYTPGGFLFEVGEGGGGETPHADDESEARHDDTEGKAQAKLMLEARRADRRVVELCSNVLDLAPSIVFSLDGHPKSELGPSTKLLVVESRLHGTFGGEWKLEAIAAFADAPWRPRRDTPKPRALGVASAVVTGPRNEEIYTDEFGRVRVMFHWDRGDTPEENRTCWLRVSQHWGGMGYGWQQIPRVGHEVIVDFLDGDPDQPVVVGRVFNSVPATVPFKLPEHKTRSVYKSHSTPKADGFNEVVFEDKKGAELVYIQAQRNLSKLVKVSEKEVTGNNQTITVGENRSTKIGSVDAISVGQKHLFNIAPRKKNGDKVELTKGPTKVEMVDKKITISVGDVTFTLDGPDIHVAAKGKIEMRAKGDSIWTAATIYLNSSPALELALQLVKPGGSGDVNDAFLVAQELAKLPMRVLQLLKAQGTKIVACRGSVTDHWTHLKGVQPRGWPPGSSWDTVPGAQSNNEVVVAVRGHGTPAGPHVPATGEGHGSQNVVIHETFHAVDLGAGGQRSASDAAFTTARNGDMGALSAYEKQAGAAGQQETYAESAAHVFGGDPNYQATHPNLYNYWNSGKP